MSQVKVVLGDITKASDDAIVNAAKPSLMGGSGVDGAIHHAAGVALLDECLKIKSVNGIRCPTGEARITTSGNLNSKYVIHTVGPDYTQDKSPRAMLIAAYTNSLKLAVKYDCKTIAFPAISCGKYAYPVEQASEIAITTCHNFENDNLEISFYLIDKSLFQVFSGNLNKI